MSATFTETVTLVKMECGSCGGTYAISESVRAKKYQSGGGWKCPYCETSWGYFGDNNENNRLKNQLEQARLSFEAKQREITQVKCALADTQASMERVEKKMRRVTKRIHAGVCPCCNRTFTNLARHMATKHPESVPSTHLSK